MAVCITKNGFFWIGHFTTCGYIILLAWHITIPGEEERKFAWKT